MERCGFKEKIVIQEDTLEIVIKINETISEFDTVCDKSYFEARLKDKISLILVAYVDNHPAGYMVSYYKNEDGSFYCWMTGVNPLFRQLGILTAFMQFLEDWMGKHSYKKLTIKTRNNRREMLSYLVKAGFNFTEVQPQPLVIDNRILLEKDIPSS